MLPWKTNIIECSLKYTLKTQITYVFNYKI